VSVPPQHPETNSPAAWRTADDHQKATWPAADWWHGFGSSQLEESTLVQSLNRPKKKLDSGQSCLNWRPPVIFSKQSATSPIVLSWDRGAKMFEEAGYLALTPGWPDDSDTVAEANAHPEVFAYWAAAKDQDKCNGLAVR
jgi:hypothetical protein